MLRGESWKHLRKKQRAGFASRALKRPVGGDENRLSGRTESGLVGLRSGSATLSSETAMFTPRTAIVFFTDDGYLELAQGLVNSLNAHVLSKHACDLFCIDIGMSQASIGWMQAAGVQVLPAHAELVPPVVRAVIAPMPHRIAQVLRPYLPQMLPDHEVIIHMDADTWVQNDQFFIGFHECLAEAPDRCVLAPGVSHYNYTFYSRIDEIVPMHNAWTFGLFERPMADALANGMFFSSGVFAMTRDCIVWKMWAEEITRVYVLGNAVNQNNMHLHEQTALNSVVRQHGLATIADPLFNFHCNSGGAMRCGKTDKVVAALVSPRREISVVHLANWRILEDKYRSNRLTFGA
jgi:hypothetical protein